MPAKICRKAKKPGTAPQAGHEPVKTSCAKACDRRLPQSRPEHLWRLCPRKPRNEAPLVQDLESELGPDLAITDAELQAMERLLGAALVSFLETKD